MFDVGGGELLLIVLAILLMFGPKKIPEIAQMVGKGMQHIKKAQSQLQQQLNEIQTEIKTVTEAEHLQKDITPEKNIETPPEPLHTVELEEVYRKQYESLTSTESSLTDNFQSVETYETEHVESEKLNKNNENR